MSGPSLLVHGWLAHQVQGSVALADRVAGVWVTDLETARRDAPQLVDPHLGSWLTDRARDDVAGTFVHVAAGVCVPEPVQTFFGREAERLAPDHRMLIVAEAGSDVSYIEGCSAPIYTPHTERHSMVEIVVKPGAMVRHTTIQNWSANVHSFVDRHATVEQGGRVEWVDATLGSRATTTRIVSSLTGAGATASAISMVSADSGQAHDVEVEMLHVAPQTSSTVLTKMLGSGDGVVMSRHVLRADARSQSSAAAHALRVDGHPRLQHEQSGSGGATASDSETQLEVTQFEVKSLEVAHLEYLMRRGLSRTQAVALIVSGYLEPVTRTLPLEYAVEWERLIELHLDRAIG